MAKVAFVKKNSDNAEPGKVLVGIGQCPNESFIEAIKFVKESEQLKSGEDLTLIATGVTAAMAIIQKQLLQNLNIR